MGYLNTGDLITVVTVRQELVAARAGSPEWTGTHWTFWALDEDDRVIRALLPEREGITWVRGHVLEGDRPALLAEMLLVRSVAE